MSSAAIRYRIDAINLTSVSALTAVFALVLGLTLWRLDGSTRSIACAASAALFALIIGTCAIASSRWPGRRFA